MRGYWDEDDGFPRSSYSCGLFARSSELKISASRPSIQAACVRSRCTTFPHSWLSWSMNYANWSVGGIYRAIDWHLHVPWTRAWVQHLQDSPRGAAWDLDMVWQSCHELKCWDFDNAPEQIEVFRKGQVQCVLVNPELPYHAKSAPSKWDLFIHALQIHLWGLPFWHQLTRDHQVFALNL